jgi:anti-sigma regulatory factor (Ser/Thr protein kinase)
MEPLTRLGPLRQPSHDRFVVAEEADVGAVRRAVPRYRALLGAGVDRLGLAELVATELGTNLLQHATPGGWILARPLAPTSIEFLAVDRGPGIGDVAAAVEGRTRMPGGLGCGLGAVRRAAARFDVYSEPGRGTAVLAVVDLAGADPAPAPRAWAGISVAITEVCGDGWAVAELDDGLAVAVIDGLGHGPRASAAADAALDAFAQDPADICGFPERANRATRDTRGGVFTVCLLRPGLGELRHVAVGNVNGRIVADGATTGLGLRSGALGLRISAPRPASEVYRWPPGATLVLWTDDLTSRIDLRGYGGLLDHDPAVVAAVLHRDHARERDDATVVVLRNLEPP